MIWLMSVVREKKKKCNDAPGAEPCWSDTSLIWLIPSLSLWWVFGGAGASISLINPSPPLYTRDGEILQRDPGRQLRKQLSSPPPTRSSPRISRGFGRTRLFLEPSGGAFDKRAPSMAEPPGNRASGFRPALIGGLHRVTAAGHLPDRLTSSRPLSIPRIPTGPCAPPPALPTALLKRRHRQRFLISGTDCHASARNSDPAESSRGWLECYRWIYGSKCDGVDLKDHVWHPRCSSGEHCEAKYQYIHIKSSVKYKLIVYFWRWDT